MVTQILILAVLGILEPVHFGATQDGPARPTTTRPSTQPAAPADEPAEVRELLEQVRSAYSGISTLRLKGVVTGTFDVAGKQSQQKVTFTSAIGDGGLFRHEIPGELIVAADSEATWVYFPAAQRYYRTPIDGAATQPATRQLPTAARQALLSHDLSLLLALSDDAAAALRTLGRLQMSEGSLLVTRTDGSTWKLEFDPGTKLISTATVDEAEALRKAGVPDVKVAMREIVYQSTPGAAIAAEALAFQPPEAAQEVEPTQPAGGPSRAGAPAPELSLPDLEGKAVSLEGLRGKVILVDFWATWCGPCVMAMPHLKALAETHGAEGMVVLAVNLREDEAAVKQFVDEHGLAAEAVMVVRDAEGSTAERWGVQAIPFSVVVGRDGVVREVIVGLQPEKLAAAVEAALEN